MKIGVFDSGLGGLSVAQTLQSELPDHKIIFRNDTEHVPYGTRDPQELLNFVLPIFEQMLDNGCGVIVVACNTVSTTLIRELRQRFTIPLVAIEPMVKPAAEQTKTNVVAVCATPTTLQSKRYQELKAQYAGNIQVLEPDCSDWALMIERNQVDERKIESQIQQLLDQKADVIVLACTHYHWIEQEIKQSVDSRAAVLQPEQAITAQVTAVLAQLQ